MFEGLSQAEDDFLTVHGFAGFAGRSILDGWALTRRFDPEVGDAADESESWVVRYVPDDTSVLGTRAELRHGGAAFLSGLWMDDAGDAWVGAPDGVRSGFDGTGTIILGTVPSGFPGNVALDVAGEHLYYAYTNGGGSGVRRMNFDGSGDTFLVDPAAGEARDMALDLVNGKLYMTTASTGFGGTSGVGNVWRSNLDGTDLENLYTAPAAGEFPRGIKVDVANQHVYFSDFNQSTIRRMDLDGSNLTTVYSGPDRIGDLFLTGLSGGEDAPVPEPGTMALLLANALLLRRLRRSRSADSNPS